MDLSQDPCQDFYLYSCNGFKKTHRLPTGYGLIDSIDVMSEVIDHRWHGLFERSDLKNHGSKAVRNSKQLYDDCMKRNESIGFEPKVKGNPLKQMDSRMKSFVNKTFKQTLSPTKSDWCQFEVEIKYPYVIDRLYLEKLFPTEEAKEANKTILSVKKAMELLDIKWVSNETNQVIKSHINSLIYNLG